MTVEVAEDVWRVQAPHVLAALLRRSGDLGACEDAVQEALLAAATQWPADGIPDNPRGWLVRVASRKLLDRQRSQAARARREQEVALQGCADAHAPSADEARGGDQDDTVHLLLLCCHPGLSPVSQVALTLRAVAGLTTAQVAAGFLVPEATMAQRVSRAKATLRRAGASFERVLPEELPARLHAVRHVLYLLFNEGYTSSSGHCAIDPNLTREAIRLTERLHRAIPEDGESTGLLALMLLTAARTPARLTTTGDLVPPGRTGPRPVGRRQDPPRHGAARADPRRRASGSLPAAGGRRRRPRPSPHLGRDGLAADLHPLPDAEPSGAVTDRDLEPGDRRRHGARSRGRTGHLGPPAARREPATQPPTPRRPRAPIGNGR